MFVRMDAIIQIPPLVKQLLQISAGRHGQTVLGVFKQQRECFAQSGSPCGKSNPARGKKPSHLIHQRGTSADTALPDPV